MHVSVVTPPAAFISLADAKSQCRIEANVTDEDALLTALVAAACGWLDGPSGWLGRSIGVQTLELRDRAFGCDRLPYGPVIEIESIQYLDALGAEQTIDEDDYQLLSNGSIEPAYNQSWPAIGQGEQSVRIRYTAGYPDTEGDDAHSTVPAAIRQATLLVIGFLYANREASADEALQNGAVSMLLGPYRRWT